MRSNLTVKQTICCAFVIGYILDLADKKIAAFLQLFISFDVQNSLENSTNVNGCTPESTFVETAFR
jgi:hypothetical protein